jgi:hypothetical protein
MDLKIIMSKSVELIQLFKDGAKRFLSAEGYQFRKKRFDPWRQPFLSKLFNYFYNGVKE